MNCVDCHKDLISIATSQGPGLDVCASGHGLRLDSGEINLFVEDYASLKRAVENTGGVAVRTKALCPRCGSHMEATTVSETSFLTCDSCRGWWLPRGSLTRLNTAYRGAAVSIHIAELELYARAAARDLARRDTVSRRSGSGQSRYTQRAVWFWPLFFGLAMVIGGLILVAGIGKAARTTEWSRPPDQTLLYLALGAIGGLALFIYGWIVNKRKRLIEGIPTSTIRSLAVGLVEISGRAQPEQSLLSAPISGLPCVFYSYAVEEWVGSDRNKRWQTIAKGTSEHPFYVADETDRILVVPMGVELILPEERIYRSNWFGELPSAPLAGLQQLGIATDGWMGNKTLRCHEMCILPEEPVYVLGTAHEHPGARERVDNPSRLYIGSGREHEFIISDRSEKELLSRLRWQTYGCWIGGLALAAICLLVMFTHHLKSVS